MTNGFIEISITMELFLMLTGFVFFIYNRLSPTEKDRTDIVFERLVIVHTCAMVLDVTSYLSELLGFPVTFSWVLAFIIIMVRVFQAYYSAIYLLEYATLKTDSFDGAKRRINYIIPVTLLVIVSSPFHHFFFYYSDGMLRMGRFFLVTHIFMLAPITISLVAILHNKKYFNRKELVSCILFVTVYISFDLVAVIRFYSVYSYMGDLLSVMIIFLGTKNDRDIRFREDRLLLEGEKNALLLSQVRPHFVYNVLTAISELCIIDPESARLSILDFSDYMRNNLDAVDMNSMIPFDKELRHVRKYLSLEMIRYGDDLSVSYNINEKGFRIPPLTVEPLVENAVKHGIRNKEGGGSIEIRSYATDEHYVITVTDDGEGFDTAEQPTDGRRHIGIESVKKRLRTLCNGDLFIASFKDVGTNATIRIPRQ